MKSNIRLIIKNGFVNLRSKSKTQITLPNQKGIPDLRFTLAPYFQRVPDLRFTLETPFQTRFEVHFGTPFSTSFRLEIHFRNPWRKNEIRKILWNENKKKWKSIFFFSWWLKQKNKIFVKQKNSIQWKSGVKFFEKN